MRCSQMNGIAVGFFLTFQSGCGGAPFELAARVADDASPSIDAQTEAEPDAIDMTKPDGDQVRPPKPDAGKDAADDAPSTFDASPPPDVQPPPPPPDTGSTCTPLPLTGHVCGLNRAGFTTPESYCIVTGFGTNPQGTSTPTPHSCLCAETFDCACILAYGVSPCGAAASCSVAAGFPVVNCP